MHPDKSPIPITSDEGSWIVAIYVIGTIVSRYKKRLMRKMVRLFVIFFLIRLSNHTRGVFDGKVSRICLSDYEIRFYTCSELRRLGRKITLLLGAVPLVIGWILIGVSQSVSVIYVARVLCGFTHGLSYSVLPMYLAEIASDKVRGSITIMLTIMAKFGILCSYAIGSYTDYRTMAWIGQIHDLLFVHFVIFI